MGKVIDTMVWIASLNKESKYHKEAIKIIEKFKNEIVVPVNILLEIFNVLTKKYNFDKNFAKNVVEEISSCVFVDGITKEDITLALEISLRTCLSIFDSLIIAFCKRRGHDLITFDKNLLKFSQK